MDELVEILSVASSPDGRKTLVDIREFLIWAFNNEFDKSKIAIKTSKTDNKLISLCVPADIKTEFLALALNYAVQKGLTNGMTYYTNSSICSLENDTEDIKTYLAQQKTDEPAPGKKERI